MPQAELVDELFLEIDKWIAAGKPDTRAKDAFGKHEGADDGAAAPGPRVTMVGASE